MFVLSADFVEQVITLYEDKGCEWVTRLPTILTACERRWELSLDVPFVYESYAYHYIAPGIRRDGTAVVVKVHAPTDEFFQEMEMLRLCDGQGMVRLLEADRDERVLLLERLLPGTPLRGVEDDRQATSYAAAVMRKLWHPVPPEHTFPSVSDWGRGFLRLRSYYGGGTGPFPKALVEEAESVFEQMSSSATEQVVLHGDLHYENILAAEREPWLAIDPKGVIGEPAYETGALVRNWLPKVDDGGEVSRVLAFRIDQLSEEVGLDRARVRDWALAQAVLSAWWNVEDGVDVEGQDYHIRIAQALAGIRR